MSDFRKDAAVVAIAGGVAVGIDGYPNGYVPITAAFHTLGGGVFAQAIGTPSAPTAVQLGVLGATAASYFIVAHDAYGNSTLPSAAGSIANGNASPSGANPVQIAIPYLPGAVSYDVLKADTAHSIALNVPAAGYGQPTYFYDSGQASTAYTTPVFDNTGYVTADGSFFSLGNGTPGSGRIKVRQYCSNSRNVNAAASLTIDPSLSTLVRVLLSATAITTMIISPPVQTADVEWFWIEVIQDGTGSRSIPTAWTNVKFPGGTYTATATANKRDLILLVRDPVDALWYAQVTLNL